MPLLLNLKLLEDRNERLTGELPVAELGLDFRDEVVEFTQPLTYQLEAQHLQDSLLVSGALELPVMCACIRCLRPIPEVIRMRNWTCHIPLEGEDCPPISRDSVDLTPFIREDMVLALPTHPVCRNDCPGLTGKTKPPLRAEASKTEVVASPWDVLNKLKLEP